MQPRCAAATVPSRRLLNRHGDTGDAESPRAPPGTPPGQPTGGDVPKTGSGVVAAELQPCGSFSASPSPPVPAGLGCATGSATSAGLGGSGKGERKGRGRAMEPLGIPASLFRFPGARPALPVLRHAGTAGAGAEPGAGLVLPRPRSRRSGPRGAWWSPHFDLLRVFSSIFQARSPRSPCAARPARPPNSPGGAGGRWGRGNKAVPSPVPQNPAAVSCRNLACSSGGVRCQAPKSSPGQEN